MNLQGNFLGIKFLYSHRLPPKALQFGALHGPLWVELFASWGEGCQLALNSGLLGTMVEPLPRTWKQGDRMSNGSQNCFLISTLLEMSLEKKCKFASIMFGVGSEDWECRSWLQNNIATSPTTALIFFSLKSSAASASSKNPRQYSVHFKFRHIIYMMASVIILNSIIGQVCFETRSQLQK